MSIFTKLSVAVSCGPSMFSLCMFKGGFTPAAMLERSRWCVVSCQKYECDNLAAIHFIKPTSRECIVTLAVVFYLTARVKSLLLPLGKGMLTYFPIFAPLHCGSGMFLKRSSKAESISLQDSKLLQANINIQ